MRKVILYGRLGKLFGRVHHLAVQSVAEAIRALDANHPGLAGFAAHLRKYSAPGYTVRVDDVYQSKDELHMQSDGAIRIAPVTRGSGKNGGVLQVILGIILVVVAIWFPPAGAAFASIGVSTGSVVMLGASMIIGGVMQMLNKPPGFDMQERPEAKASYSYDGVVNTSHQANPVPVCYGRVRVGSQVVSASITTEELAL